MADDSNSGDKTEQPTPKRLDDARKKGDVCKSKEVTSAVGLVLWLALAALVTSYAVQRIAALYEAMFVLIGQGWTADGFGMAARNFGAIVGETALSLVALLVLPAALIGVLTDYLQIGSVLSFEKVTPKLENMNPVSGVKRMFSMDNLIEVIKALAKTILLLLVGWLVVEGAMPQIVALAHAPQRAPLAIVALIGSLTIRLLGATVALFALVAVLDAVYQRHSYMKKMRMSMRDIKQEMKESDGDPHMKQHRRQAAQEGAQRGAAQAARQANVLVVNPTHVAIAIDYDRETHPVPTIAAKGEDHVARAMRAAAEEAGVPVVRNIPLARDLLARAEIGEVIPADLFDIIAEVILWARDVRAEVEAQRAAELDPMAAAAVKPAAQRRPPPGEDLTRYPDLHR